MGNIIVSKTIDTFMSSSNSIQAKSALGINTKEFQTVLEVSRTGVLDDNTSNLIYTGTGESSYSMSNSSVALKVGSRSKQPGRIYTEGRNFYNAGEIFYLNGCNTPWRTFNEFGGDGIHQGAYNHEWWASEFSRLSTLGVNSVRVWINDNSENSGIILNNDGTINNITTLFWDNVNDMLSLAETNGIYVMVSVLSFDHFSWNTPGSEKYHQMIGSSVGVQSWIDNFIIPLAQISETNKYLFSIDLGNEVDAFYEASDTATGYNIQATPVGGGSYTVNFSQRLDDYAVGQRISINSVDMGTIVTRVSDTQCITTNPYSGTSQTFTAGQWAFMTKNKKSYQRYIAMCSAAIHSLSISPLVTVGVQSLKYSTSSYGDSDYYTDDILSSITGDSLSKLDFNQIHWYQWAEPYFPLMRTPQQHGLSNKPSIYGEIPAHWGSLNGVDKSGHWVYGWSPYSYFNIGDITFTDDGTNKRLYRCTQAGNSGPIEGVAGGDMGPTGTSSGIIDGNARWDYCNNNSTFIGLSTYNTYDMLISYDGGLWVCSAGGETSNSGGPYGTGPIYEDGTAEFTYLRQVITDPKTFNDWLLSNGWAGCMPWSSNAVDRNGGFFITDFNRNVVVNWEGSRSYYTNDMVFNENNLYRCIIAGTSSSGPSGTNTDIVDGTVHWTYTSTPSNIPYTTAGIAISGFSSENHTLLFPDLSAPWYNIGTACRQSKSRAWYVNGNTNKFIESFTFSEGISGVTQRVGAFDELDGLFLQAEGENRSLSIVIRNKTVDYVVPRVYWNIDKLDGTGLSGIILDLSQPQTFVIEFGFGRTSKNRFGFIIKGETVWIHEMSGGNIQEINPSNPNLPLRWEITSTGILQSPVSLITSTGCALSDGPGPSTMTGSYNNEFVSKVIPGSSVIEFMAIRINPTSLSFTTATLSELNVQTTSTGVQDRIEWWVELNPEISNDSPWISMNKSNVQIAVQRNVSSPGKRIAGGFGVNSIQATLNNLPPLAIDENGNGDIYSIQIRNIESYGSYYWASVSWIEKI